MAEAHDRLRRLAAALQGGRTLPPDVARWLDTAVTAYLEQGGRSSLDTLLGLKGRGVHRLATQEAREKRDAALRVCLEHAHDGEPRPAHQRARRLTEEVKRFDRKWPRICHLDEPPADLNRLQREIFRLYQAGAQVPSDPGYLLARAYGKKKK